MQASFVLTGAVLRGPGLLLRARSGRGKRGAIQASLGWQVRYLGALDPCRVRARAAGNAGRRDTGVVGLAGAVLRGPGPLPRARSGRGKRWQARHRRRLGWQARYLGALDLAARALGPRETLAGATQASFVLAGAVLRGPGPLPRARSGRGKRWQARHRRRWAGRRGT